MGRDSEPKKEEDDTYDRRPRYPRFKPNGRGRGRFGRSFSTRGRGGGSRDSRSTYNDRSGRSDDRGASTIDKDNRNGNTYKPAAPRYNVRFPNELMDKQGLHSSTLNKFDQFLEQLKLARKKNEIKFHVLAESKYWPHGRLTAFLTKLVAKKRETVFFDMLQQHIEEERKSPSSMFNSINVSTSRPGGEVDLQAMLQNDD